MDKGIVYVVHNKWIRNPETNEMPYKIGFTRKSVEERYFTLGLKMPVKFEALFAYEFDDCKKAENLIHGILDKKRVAGEWFNVNQEEIEHIIKTCELMGGVLVTDEVESEIAIETEHEDIATLTSVEELLRTMEMKTFVKYYDKFKNVSSHEIKQCMESDENYTKNSIDTKVSAGKRIFKENLNIQALDIISNSNRVDDKAREDALKILDR